VLAAAGLSWELIFGAGLASENFMHLTRGREHETWLKYGAFPPHEHERYFDFCNRGI